MLKSKKIIRDLKHIKGCKYFGICEVSSNVKEACLFDIYSEGACLDAYDVMLDIENLRNKKSIKKALIEYLQQENIDA